MTRINTIANLTQQFSFKKEKPFDNLLALVNALPEEAFNRADVQREPAALYLQFFKPFEDAKTNKKLSILQQMIPFTGKQAVRYYLNYIYVDANQYATASDGCTLITTRNRVELEPGFYDPKALVKSQDGMKFPNFKSILDNSEKLQVCFAKISTINDVRVTDGKKLHQEFSIGGGWWNEEYIKRARKVTGPDAVMEVRLDNKNHAVLALIETDDFKIILMPVRD